ncbi:lysosomal alpha-mannosidase-like [Rhynchophorus ferrugineus]|uniref:lysosomal alpha-mannosidase-like n=1 Tax=Rhynchophorus ferrugineus TaxID=354439 RepID=UPI003FCEDA6F
MFCQWMLLGFTLLFEELYGFPSVNIKEEKCGYESCHPVKEGFINVHIVPHTHDDVGWLKTVDQYYYGSNTNIQRAGVQYILQTVMDSLRKSENRRFIYVETAFFWKWWVQQSPSIQEEVKHYVNNGRLEFIGGGWSMNDEAATHYHSIIDQMSWGLRILNDTFGECGRPKIGWQIDPFGHSKEMANIFSQLGFDAFLMGRIDYQDKEHKWETKTPEVVWRSSKSLGESSDIFTGVLYNTYSPPPGFCFDLLCSDIPFIDDPNSFDYNVDARVDEFITYVDMVSQVYTTNNILITMGSDFHYQDAEAWFINLDKLIYYVNKRQETGSKYNLIYSTPSCYVKAVNDEAKDQEWLVKEDDFFPYASDPHAYWTGYFVSRPAIKRFERLGNNFLQICKQLYTFSDLGFDDNSQLNNLREVMGILQHHDAVAGTEKQHVANDYARLLQRAINGCENITGLALNKLMSLEAEQGDKPALPLFTCPLANISQCSVTEESENFVVTVYNPLSRYINKTIKLPVKGSGYTVVDGHGKSYLTQILPIADVVANIPGRQSDATNELYFIADDIPPLGWKSFIVSLDKSIKPEKILPVNLKDVRKIGTAGASLDLDPETGRITRISMEDTAISLNQNFYTYNGFVGDNSLFESRSSGAYIFRPTSDTPNDVSNHTVVSVYEGALVSELRQELNDYISQIVRINNIEKSIEYDWLIGPIPTHGSNGIEVITRYSTNLTTNGTFYTDSNGKEMLKRVRNFRPTWDVDIAEFAAGNYYPVTSEIAIRDEELGMELAILNDRAQGGTSLNDGEIEVMIHRNCLHDDAFGVEEALNEQAFGKGLVVRGSHYLTLGWINSTNGNSNAVKAKDIAQRKLLDAWTFITPLDQSIDEYKSTYTMEYSGLKEALPRNIQILTLEPWRDSSFLLRLEHVFDYDEDSILSQPALVKLQDLFSGFDIVSLEESTLGGNQWLKDNTRLKFKTKETQEPSKSRQEIEDNLEDFEIALSPSQIRTFIIKINRK